MREILFRGKCVDSGEWVYGVPIKKALVGSHDGYYPKIIPECDGRHQTVYSTAIEEETVGQYTGLTDKNGLTKIFEYDIIDANGRKVGNYYENSNLLKDGTCLLVARMGTKEWSRSEQEAIKRGCKYAE